MKRISCNIVLLMISVLMLALPARRGQWRSLTLEDGSSVVAEARGDEYFHYWRSAEGDIYVKDAVSGRYRKVDASTDWGKLTSGVTRAKGGHFASRPRFVPKRRAGSAGGDRQRALMILVQFPDCRFSMPDPKAFYQRVTNEKGFSEANFKGSVRDYFLEQSGGKLDLNYDVAGPVTMPKNFSYYGLNDDAKAGEMVNDACLLVDGEIDFSAYDYDRDGVAEEVYVLYAGYGQADHSDEDKYIWPHAYSLNADHNAGKAPLVLDGTEIDVYACSNELQSDDQVDGIGTICHEFSHCLGLADMYDTSPAEAYAMGYWDIMDGGCYNGDGYLPSGYSGFEKWQAGWITPVELSADTTITGLRPQSEGGTSYVIYNEAKKDEYYIIENRQRKGYDADLPGHGLVVTHVDYNATAWEYNIVNAVGKDAASGFNNTHQRATIVAADNRRDYDTERGDAYPYQGNDSLTHLSMPAAILYNKNVDGSKMMILGLFNIKEHSDGTMSFEVRESFKSKNGGVEFTVDGEEILLHETFNNCNGSGGNDGAFMGSVASAQFNPDLQGWSDYTRAYGGDQCARFGNSYSGNGSVTSPEFILNGDTLTLRFKAAGWEARADGTDLLLSLNGGSATFVQSNTSEVLLTMQKGAWQDYELKIVGSGSASITFNPSKRFFLDEVMVTLPVKTSIRAIEQQKEKYGQSPRIYTIDGRAVHKPFDRLSKGIYIVNGRKVIK